MDVFVCYWGGNERGKGRGILENNVNKVKMFIVFAGLFANLFKQNWHQCG